MKINITKREYLLLLDLLYLSNWVMNACHVGERPDTVEYRELHQKFLSYAKEFGQQDLVEYDKRYGKSYYTKLYEDESKSHNFIDEYENEVFWDELVDRLVKRDVLREHGEEALRKMDFREILQASESHEIRYNEEFENHGIQRLVIEV